MSHSEANMFTDQRATSLCAYQHWWRWRHQHSGGDSSSSSNDGPQQTRSPDSNILPSLPAPSFQAAGSTFHTPLESPDHSHTSCVGGHIYDTEKGLGANCSLHSTLCSKNASRHSLPINAPLQLSLRGSNIQPSTPRRARLLRASRYIRYTIFTAYQRLFTIVVLSNITAACILHSRQPNPPALTNPHTLASLTAANFLVAIAIRQDAIVNLLFRSAWLVPWSVPLRVRRIVARVYCYGGIHSGAALVGTGWWIWFCGVMVWRMVQGAAYTAPLVVVSSVLATLLICIVVLALPPIRERWHNTFELSHRLLGWFAITLFWVQLMLLARADATVDPRVSMGMRLAHSSTTWCLALTTVLLIYPWVLLRRWSFILTPLSSHALLLTTNNPVHRFSCLSISTSPLREWHPFATFPSGPRGCNNTNLIISSAGDWTRSMIARGTDNPTSLTLYIKSHPVAGVLSLSCLFRRVVLVTTGSGIGPCLSSLLDRPESQFARLVWSARAPLRTYGRDVLGLVAKADREAVVIDTQAKGEVGGRPDLLVVAERVYAEVGAEAVFVLSNRGVTERVVRGLTARGIPTFGPIWDS